MPQDAAYRKYTEQLVNERFNHVKVVSEGVENSYSCLIMSLFAYRSLHSVNSFEGMSPYFQSCDWSVVGLLAGFDPIL